MRLGRSTLTQSHVMAAVKVRPTNPTKNKAEGVLVFRLLAAFLLTLARSRNPLSIALAH